MSPQRRKQRPASTLSWRRQGTFWSGALRRWDEPANVVVPATFVSALAVNRGVDLVRSDSPDSLLLLYVHILGQDAWGFIIVAAGLSAALGMFAHRVGTAVLGFGVAWALMVGYAFVMLQGFLATSPDLTGARFVGPAIGYAGLYGYWLAVTLKAMVVQLTPPNAHCRRAGDRKPTTS